jgi:succinate dehydrogenase/fumarate reductase flavoprotein subunit
LSDLSSKSDVIVVGGGGSGLAAAVSAAENGARVVLLEKNPELGGSTRWSVGSVTSSGTPHQRRAGISDTTEAHFEDLGKMDGPLVERDNPALRRLLTANVPDTFAWLRKMGVEFHGPMEEPPHRVARMHIVLPNSKAYIYHLSRRARKLGVEIRLSAHVKRILVEDNRAVGVETDGPRGPVALRAGKAIILAGGDYSGNSAMKAELVDPLLGGVPAVNPTATGDCQRMVEEIGGKILNSDLALGPVLRFVRPPKRPFYDHIPPHRLLTRGMRFAMNNFPDKLIRPFVMGFMTTVMGPEMSLFRNGALLIGSRGDRLTFDGATTPGKAVAATGDNRAYILFDEKLAERYSAWPHFISTAPGVAYAYLPDYRRTRPDLCHDGADAADIARAIGADPDVLTETIGEAGLSGPYHALGPLQTFVVYTDGGAMVSERLEVLRADGTPIEGLFAAGSTGQGGLLLEGHGHHLGWAFTSGRLAGRRAALLEASA